MNKLLKTIFILALSFISIPPAFGDDPAVDLGLTPSPVYGLWGNINRAVIVYASVRSTDKDWIKELGNMRPNKFYNKAPADVLKLVDRFRTKLRELDDGMSGNTSDTLLEGKLPNLLLSEDNSITPSLVYLHSGQVLVNIANDILQTSVEPIEISNFFQEYSFTGAVKTPSDVFGFVDLGVRRLEEIAIKKKSGQLITNQLIKRREKVQ